MPAELPTAWITLQNSSSGIEREKETPKDPRAKHGTEYKNTTLRPSMETSNLGSLFVQTNERLTETSIRSPSHTSKRSNKPHDANRPAIVRKCSSTVSSRGGHEIYIPGDRNIRIELFCDFRDSGNEGARDKDFGLRASKGRSIGRSVTVTRITSNE